MNLQEILDEIEAHRASITRKHALIQKFFGLEDFETGEFCDGLLNDIADLEEQIQDLEKDARDLM
jgi:hypothetical protein